MDKIQYINGIVRSIKCSKNKKSEIKKQLMSDIDERLNQGESLDKIIDEMGSQREIANGFNESISSKEKKKYLIHKALCIVIPSVAVIIILCCIAMYMIPRSLDINQSNIFDSTKVELKAQECIELMDKKEYNKLQELATDEMKQYLTSDYMDKARDGISSNFGNRQAYGTAYIFELIQKNQHYAVCEITTSYDNVVVTYRITFDKNMKLAGVFMR